MTINTTILGQFFVAFAIFMVCTCFYLGRQKTQHPFFVSFIGLCLTVIPPLAFVFLLILVLKQDCDRADIGLTADAYEQPTKLR